MTSPPKYRYTRVFRLLILLGVAASAIAGSVAAQTSKEEDKQEAAYLKRILAFVEWPKDGVAEGEGFHVCVAGSYGISFALSDALRGLSMNGRKVEVRWVQKEKDMTGCQVLILAGEFDKQREKMLETAKGAHTLTVGEGSRFVDAGGILGMNLGKNAVQFEVNLVAARNAGLKIDARLLALAHRVVTEKGTSGT